jgi:hypothetical protein
MAVRQSLAVLVALVISSVAVADTLLIDAVESNARSALSRPTRGMSMERVESLFGSPTARVPAVGDPPITRWEYPDFIVYFEYEIVLHSAVRRR